MGLGDTDTFGSTHQLSIMQGSTNTCMPFNSNKNVYYILILANLPIPILKLMLIHHRIKTDTDFISFQFPEHYINTDI